MDFTDLGVRDLQWLIPAIAGALVLVIGCFIAARRGRFGWGGGGMLVLGAILIGGGVYLAAIQPPPGDPRMQAMTQAATLLDGRVEANGQATRALAEGIETLRAALEDLREAEAGTAPATGGDAEPAQEDPAAARLGTRLEALEGFIAEAKEAADREATLRREFRALGLASPAVEGDGTASDAAETPQTDAN